MYLQRINFFFKYFSEFIIWFWTLLTSESLENLNFAFTVPLRNLGKLSWFSNWLWIHFHGHVIKCLFSIQQVCWRTLPDFPEVFVSQGSFCRDAFIRIVGKHLVEQWQSWGRAVGDEPCDTPALLRGEIETHRPRPARNWETIKGQCVVVVFSFNTA